MMQSASQSAIPRAEWSPFNGLRGIERSVIAQLHYGLFEIFQALVTLLSDQVDLVSAVSDHVHLSHICWMRPANAWFGSSTTMVIWSNRSRLYLVIMLFSACSFLFDSNYLFFESKAAVQVWRTQWSCKFHTGNRTFPERVIRRNSYRKAILWIIWCYR